MVGQQSQPAHRLKITVLPAGPEFGVDAHTSLLEAALAAGLNLPHSCRGGNCGSCRARVVSGEFQYPNGRPLGISDAEISEGQALLCQARALSDMELEIRSVALAGETHIKRLPCRIDRCERWSHDVMGVYLRLPAAEEFEFQPGQYLDVLLPGGRRRSFSIASPPQGSHLLELHVRLVPHGEFTAPLFSRNSDRKLLNIEGPLGRFLYRESAAPMLLIGGGTGFAPLNSIIRHVLDRGLDRRMSLFWGCRAQADLYADTGIKILAQRNPRLEYVPVLSDADSQWRGPRGFVHEEVLRRIDDLTPYDIYASGPPAMIDAVRTQFLARGVSAERIYFDSFDYAPDSIERHRRMLSTSS
jgi:CDP-4-dehydro-6-deoxyglucose reductase